MDVLAAVDGSDCSMRALRFAVDFVDRYDADLHVVHFSDAETAATDEILDRVRGVLDDADAAVEPELAIDERLETRTAAHAGEAIVEMAESEGFDHVVMGHHGSSRVERAILGSAAETVVRSKSTPVTVVP